MNVDKISFGHSQIVKGVKLKTGVRSKILRKDDRTFQEIMGFGKPKQGVVTGFENLNAIHEKIRSGEKLTEYEELYYMEMRSAIASSFAEKDIEELFGALS